MASDKGSDVAGRSQFHGPSAIALQALEQVLASRLGSSSRDQGRAARVGQDLFALTSVVRSEPRFRRAVTDPSVDSSAKEGLVRKLFRRKVDSVALELMTTAVAQRWSSPADLAVALERLGVETTVRSADDPGRLADELFAVQRLLTDEPGLRDALADPSRSLEDRRALVDGLLAGRVSEQTLHLVVQGLGGTHRTVGLALEDYQRMAADVQGERVATVRTARPLSETERERLEGALSRQYDRAVHLNVVLDEGLIGGIRVEIGNDVIDGSVASRLDDARRRLAG